MSKEAAKKQGFWKSLTESFKSLLGIKSTPATPAAKRPEVPLKAPKTTPEKEEIREIKIQEEKKPFYELKPLNRKIKLKPLARKQPITAEKEELREIKIQEEPLSTEDGIWEDEKKEELREIKIQEERKPSPKLKPLNRKIKLKPLARKQPVPAKEELREIKIQEERKPFYELKPLNRRIKPLAKEEPSPAEKEEIREIKIQEEKDPSAPAPKKQPPKKSKSSSSKSSSSRPAKKSSKKKK